MDSFPQVQEQVRVSWLQHLWPFFCPAPATGLRAVSGSDSSPFSDLTFAGALPSSDNPDSESAPGGTKRQTAELEEFLPQVPERSKDSPSAMEESKTKMKVAGLAF